MTEATKILEKVTIPDLFPTMAAKDYARITGEDAGFRARSFFYKAFNEEYQEVVGGFAPPAKLPGFGVVIGLGRNEDPAIKEEWGLGARKISVLAEFEVPDMPNLVSRALAMRKIFSPALDKGFYCDGDDALAFRVSQLMDLLKDEQPIVTIPGLYFKQATSFRDYVATLFLYQRILSRRNCTKVRQAMNVFPREAMTARGETAWEDYPAITALAYAVHGLMVNPMLDVNEGVIEADDLLG